jgi:hypothetical protein
VAKIDNRDPENDPLQRIRDDIVAGRLTGDRLIEARTWLGSAVQREENERKRKRYGWQMATLFLIAVVAFAGGMWAFKKIVGTTTEESQTVAKSVAPKGTR